jgi:hypothetical protein
MDGTFEPQPDWPNRASELSSSEIQLAGDRSRSTILLERRYLPKSLLIRGDGPYPQPMSEKVPEKAQEEELAWERVDNVKPTEKTTHVPEENVRNIGTILAEVSEDPVPPTFTELVEENRKLKAQISDLNPPQANAGKLRNVFGP